MIKRPFDEIRLLNKIRLLGQLRRYLGYRWLIFRVFYAWKIRLGIFSRKIPPTNWKPQPLRKFSTMRPLQNRARIVIFREIMKEVSGTRGAPTLINKSCFSIKDVPHYTKVILVFKDVPLHNIRLQVDNVPYHWQQRDGLQQRSGGPNPAAH